MSTTSRSSYRKTFGGNSSFSTVGSIGRKSFGGAPVEESITRTFSSYSYNAAPSATSTSSIDLDIGRLKLNEKETLNGLNNRFATYIDKVRSLEAKNQQLTAKLNEYKSQENATLTPDQVQYLNKLRAQVNDASLERSRSEIQRDNLVGEASELRWKLDHEHHLRSELDDELSRLRKDVDDATMVRIDLERKIETLREELDYAKKMHEEEIEDIKSQIEGQGIGVEADGLVPDISELLREIRAQYELIVEKNRDETETWYKTKFEDLEMKSKQNADDLDKVQGDINDYRKQVTQLEMELESLKGSNDYLERNLSETEKRYENEAARHQAHVARLSVELERANDDMKRHLADYKLLMNQKLSLEKEIRTYRRLLEGETESDGKIVSSSVSEKEMVEDVGSSTDSQSDEDEDKNLD